MARPTREDIADALLELWVHTLGRGDVELRLPARARTVIDPVVAALRRERERVGEPVGARERPRERPRRHHPGPGWERVTLASGRTRWVYSGPPPEDGASASGTRPR